MSTVAVFLADGFEEVEALAVVDLCRRAGLDTPMVSVMGGKEVTGSHGIQVLADMLIGELDFDSIDMIMLPGGLKGTEGLENCSLLTDKIKEFDANGKLLSAICAAPTILAHKGLLKGRNACCYPSMEEHLVKAEAVVRQEPVEVSGHITTSRGMGTAMELGLAIVERFQGREAADELARTVVYKRI